MIDRPITIETIPASEARQKFGELIKQVYNRDRRIIVEKGGIPVIAFVSLDDLERWTRRDRERAERFRVIDEIRARNVDKSPEEVERDVAEEIVELRRERRERGDPPMEP
ncbi:MAG: type II toxin-antitoxin system Phd/YefM family antitoxin [Chloroflexota bacterium]